MTVLGVLRTTVIVMLRDKAGYRMTGARTDMGEEYICKIPDCKCGGRKGRSELEDENAELHKLLSLHDKHWRAIADAIGTDGGYGGVDGKDGEYWGNAECVIRRVRAIKEVATEAASVVKRAGRRPDGTAWANLNINDLAKKVADLGSK